MDTTILVIEDEPSIADTIVYALSTEGFTPLWKSSGQAGLEAVQEKKIALVVLDVGLPDESGFEIARAIRKFSEVPIIFLTARSEEVDRIVGLELGADDYLVKPFSPRELTARIKAILRRSRKESPSTDEAPPRRYGPFEVDEHRFRISFHGQPVELSRYEFRILQILLKSPGRVYSRGQLMDMAWEDPDMSLERTVDTHVKTIRQKLKAIRSEEEPIVTHRGLGYSLREES